MAITSIEKKYVVGYLTDAAVGFYNNTDGAEFIAPSFSVPNISGKYLKFTKGDHRVVEDKLERRVPTKEIEVNSDDDTYLTEEYGSHVWVSPRDEKNFEASRARQIEISKVRVLKSTHMLNRLNRITTIALNTSLVDNTSATAAWSSKTTATPISDVLAASNSINNAIGQPANKIALNYEAAIEMWQTDEFNDKFKGVFNRKAGEGDMSSEIASVFRYFGIEPMVVDTRGVSTAPGNASDPAWESLFSGKVLLFQSEPGKFTNEESSTFMSSPFINKETILRFPYDNNQRGYKIEMRSDIDELLVRAEAGYIITGV